MTIAIQRLSRLFLATAFCALIASSVLAQSSTRQSKDYGSTALNGIHNSNSASRYTVGSVIQQNLARSVTSPGVSGINQSSYTSFLAPPSPRTSPRTKPFSSISRGPAVTPYITYSGSLNTVSDYYSIIRPQQRQRQINLQQQRHNFATQRRLNQLAARPPYNPRGSDSIAPTGHAAVFQSAGNYLNLGSFYPQAGRRR